MKFTTFEISDNSIFFQFAENLTFTKLNTVYSLFNFLVELFKKLKIPQQNKCHNCGTIDRITYYDLNDSGIILCNPCNRKIENNFYETENVPEEKKYLMGFLGSLFFSIPIIITWVLIAVYLEILASTMAIFIAFIGLKGYAYFKGEHGKLTKYIIVTSNIISILIANAATVITLLVRDGLTISQALIIFKTSQAVRDIFNENTVISFILAFFVWIWHLFILEDKKMTIKLAKQFQK